VSRKCCTRLGRIKRDGQIDHSNSASLMLGLLRLFGGRSPPPPRLMRGSGVGAQLLRSTADVCRASGGVRTAATGQTLVSEIHDVYPWVGYDKKFRLLGLNNSLMTFSRRAMSASVELFHAAPLDERVFDHKVF